MSIFDWSSNPNKLAHWNTQINTTNSRGHYWYVNGKLHRIGGPAVTRHNGTMEWYCSGQLHRLDGPAIMRQDGTLAWYQNDKLHRLDGPAVQYPGGYDRWYYQGTKVRVKSQKEFEEWLQLHS